MTTGPNVNTMELQILRRRYQIWRNNNSHYTVSLSGGTLLGSYRKR